MSSRPKPTASIIGEKKQKKPQQSSRKNTIEVRQKGRMDKTKKLMDPQDLDEEELNMGVECIDAEEEVLITWLPPYVLPRKSTIKVTKDPDSVKYKLFTPLLPEDVPMEGDLLA